MPRKPYHLVPQSRIHLLIPGIGAILPSESTNAVSISDDKFRARAPRMNEISYSMAHGGTSPMNTTVDLTFNSFHTG